MKTGRLYLPAQSYPMASYSLKVLIMTYQTYFILGAFVHVLCSAWNTFSADIRRPHSLSSFTSLLNVSFSETFSNHLHSLSWNSPCSFPALFFPSSTFHQPTFYTFYMFLLIYHRLHFNRALCLFIHCCFPRVWRYTWHIDDASYICVK